MNKKLLVGLIIAAIVIIGGGIGYYYWQASADAFSQDYCAGVKGTQWKNCVQNMATWKKFMQGHSNTQFTRVINFMDNQANPSKGSSSGSSSNSSACPAVMKTCPDGTLVGYDTAVSGCVYKACPAVAKPVLTSSSLLPALTSGENAESVLTLNGTGFGATQGTSTLKLNTGDLQVVSWSDTKVTCKISALRLVVGSYPVTLTTAGGSVTVSVPVGAQPNL